MMLNKKGLSKHTFSLTFALFFILFLIHYGLLQRYLVLIMENYRLFKEFVELRCVELQNQKYPEQTKIKLEELIAHAGGSIKGIMYTNSLEALNNSYCKGFRFLEVDIEWTSDSHLVLIHDWDETVSRLFGVKPGIYTLSEFKNFKIIQGLTQMTFDDLANWLREHPNAFVIIDIKRDVITALKQIGQKYPEFKSRIIPENFRFREYNEVRKLGFNAIIFSLYVENYSDESVLRFLKNRDVIAVAMPIGRARARLPLKLNSMGIFVYAHTVNDIETKKEIYSNGVNGIYTDFLEVNKNITVDIDSAIKGYSSP